MTIGRPERILTEEQLQERLNYWQKRLNLFQWYITVNIARSTEIEGEGQNNYNTALMESRITLIDPIDHEALGAYDMEFILVHELLHLIVEVNRHSRTYSDREEIDLEYAINALARSFMQFEDEKGERG